MAVYAIGDLQGCLDPLQQLLDQVAFDPARDRLWFTGDLVNRGPASLETLRFVHALDELAVVVLGNHDLHLLATAFTDQRSKKQRGDLEEILAAPDRDELLDWLRRRPLLHHDAELDFTMVHAGMPPQWDLAAAQAAAGELEAVLASDDIEAFLRDMYGNQPAQWDPALTGVARLRYIVNAFTRLRFLQPDGSLEFVHKGPTDRAGSELIPWFRFPGRRSANLRLIFGHWSLLRGIAYEGTFSIDTGCVYGGSMTAMRLDDLSRSCVDCAPGWYPKKRRSRYKGSG